MNTTRTLDWQWLLPKIGGTILHAFEPWSRRAVCGRLLRHRTRIAPPSVVNRCPRCEKLGRAETHIESRQPPTAPKDLRPEVHMILVRAGELEHVADAGCWCAPERTRRDGFDLVRHWSGSGWLMGTPRNWRRVDRRAGTSLVVLPRIGGEFEHSIHGPCWCVPETMRRSGAKVVRHWRR